MHKGRAALGQVSLNNKKKMAIKIGRDEHRQMTGQDLKYHVSESLQSRHFSEVVILNPGVDYALNQKKSDSDV